MQTRIKVSRNTNIDLVKLISAFGVISAHVPADLESGDFFNQLAPFRVPFFYFTSILYFSMTLNQSNSIQERLKKITQRLVFPYLAWTFVYIALIFVKYYITNGQQSINFLYAILYGNTAVQMYFLPQLLGMQLLMLATFFICRRNSQNKFLGVIVFILTSAYFIYGNNNHVFGVLSYHSILFYIVFAYHLGKIIQNNTRKDILIAFGILLLTLTFYWRFSNPPYLRLFPIGGVGLTLLLFSLKTIKLPKVVMYLASLSFGVFLSHEVFIQIFKFIFHNILHFSIKYTVVSKFIVTSVILVISSFSIVGISKIERLRKVFLGY
jgi:hypothetical protein